MVFETVGGIIRAQSCERPDAIAIEFEGRSVTFAELERRSNRVANALRGEGLTRQDRVAFVDRNCPEYFEVAFGIGKVNAINVGVNWRLTPSEMLQVLNDAQPAVIVVGADFTPHMEKIVPELEGNPRIVVLGGHDHWTDYEAWLAGESEEDPMIESAPDDVAFIIFTSGTTGVAKGAMMTEKGFRAAFSALDRWRLDATSVNLAMMPMFHFAGSGWSLLSLALGCRTVLLRDVDPTQILQAIETFGITNIVMPPAVIQFLLMAPEVDTTDLGSLRAVLYGGSPISETVLTAATESFGCEFLQLYGLTETAGGVALLDGPDHDPVNRPDLLRSCGRPYPWVELRIVEPGTGADVASGAVGELWIRAPQNTPGYWRDPAATADAITPDGWLKTGDIGYQDAEGYVFLSDRVHDMIVSGAENVYPTEVENALIKHRAVADVAVIGVPDDRWGESVKAVVVKKRDQDLTGEELIAFAREHLAGYKLPKSVDFVDELPRSPTGKVLRRVLREPHWTAMARAIS